MMGYFMILTEMNASNTFHHHLTQLMNPNGVATWWNALPTPSNVFGIDGVEYQEFSINPPKNTYFNHTKYYLPKKQF
jgi:hypothetical protein